MFRADSPVPSEPEDNRDKPERDRHSDRHDNRAEHKEDRERDRDRHHRDDRDRHRDRHSEHTEDRDRHHRDDRDRHKDERTERYRSRRDDRDRYHREDRDRHRDRHRDEHAEDRYRHRDERYKRHNDRHQDREPKRRRYGSPRRRSPSPVDPNMRDVYSYELISPIAEGVFGSVFLAKDSKHARYAVKRLKLSDPAHYDAQYKREIDVLQQCDHKNIVKLIEVVRNTKNEKFLVLEYCPTEFKVALANIVLPSQLKNVIHQLLTGLEYIHGKNIIHRDLKPDNILFTTNGILKIADFGSSRIWREGYRFSPGMVTLRYRAPEIFLGATNYTPAVDIWSAACIASEVLLGRPLLDGISELEQIDKMCTVLGSPNESNWPGFKNYPNSRKLVFPTQEKNFLKKYLPDQTEECYSFLLSLFVYNPSARSSAAQALQHPYWSEEPLADAILRIH